MTHSVSVFANGEQYDIPHEQIDAFRESAAASGAQVEDADNFRVNGELYTIPKSQIEAFRQSAPNAESVRAFTMKDGSTKFMTTAETSKYLRSKEYRELADHQETEQGSVGWEATKGAILGAAEGAYKGGKAQAGKIAAAIPEALASVSEAAGNALNAGGNMNNALGEYFKQSGQGVKAWLNEHVKSDLADEMGYEDWSTRMSNLSGDVAAMAVKFAPAQFLGAGYMEAIMAADGINAYADMYDRAKGNGASDADANMAGLSAGLINYFGTKLLMKGGAKFEGVDNVILRELGKTGMSAGAMALQSGGTKVVENAADGKALTEGVGEAVLHGGIEGAQFHMVNEMGTRGRQVLKESRDAKNMRKEALVAAAETNEGGDFLNTIIRNKGMDDAVKARREGKDVSRKMGVAADLPDNMNQAERNSVVDSIMTARERARAQISKENEVALNDEVAQISDSPKTQKAVLEAAKDMLLDYRGTDGEYVTPNEVINDPTTRARLVAKAVERVYGAQEDGMERKAADKKEIEAEIDARAKQTAKERYDARVARMNEDLELHREAANEAKKEEKIAAKIAEREAERQEDIAEQVKAKKDAEERARAEAKAKEQREYDEKMAEYEEARAKREAEKKKFGKAKTPLPEKPVEPVAEKPVEAPAPKTEPKKAPIRDLDKILDKGKIGEEDKSAIKALIDKRVSQGFVIKGGHVSDGAFVIHGETKDGHFFQETYEPKKTEPKEVVSKTEATTSADAVKSAQKLLGTKFYQDEAALKREMSKLPPQATKAREAYETALAEARKRAEAEKSEDSIKVGGKVKLDDWRKNPVGDLQNYGTVEGTVVSIEGDTAKIRTKSGKIREFPTNKLKTPSEYEADNNAVKDLAEASMRAMFEGRLSSNDTSQFASDAKTINELKGDDYNDIRGALFKTVREMNGQRTIDLQEDVIPQLRRGIEKIEGPIKEKAQKVLSQLENGQGREFEKEVNSLLRELNDKLSKPEASKTEKPPKAVNKSKKTNADKVVASKIKNFVAKHGDAKNDSLMLPNHTAEGKVVATDGRMLIETTRGFDKSKVGENAHYPNYKQVIPDDKRLTRSVEVDPSMLANAAKEAVAAAKATKQAVIDGDALVALKFGDEIAYVSAKRLKVVSEVMDAEGITTIKWGGGGPLVAKNDNTTIALMPLRDFESDSLVISGHSGKVVQSVKLVDRTEDIKGYKDILSQKDISANERITIEKKLAAAEKEQGFIDRIKEQMVDENLAKKFLDPNDSTLAEISETYQRATDPKRQSESKVVAWAMRNGWSSHGGRVSADAVRSYDRAMAKGALEQAKKWFPGMKAEYYDHGREAEAAKLAAENNDGLELRDRSGHTLGWFMPSKNSVALLPGANAETVAHEIAWHGTRHWAKGEAAKGNTKAQKLFDKMREVENACPDSLKKQILQLYRKDYAGRSADDFYNEFGAWDFMTKGGEALEKALAKAENRAWYAKWWLAAKDMVRGFFGKEKLDYVDLDELDHIKGPEQFKDWLAEAFANGKTLAKVDPKTGKAVEIATNKEESLFSKAARKLHDHTRVLAEIVNEAKAKGLHIINTGKFADNDVASAKALQQGEKEAARQLVEGKMRELATMLNEGNITIKDVEDYMAAKATKGRHDLLWEKRGWKEAASEMLAAQFAEKYGREPTESELDRALANFRKNLGRNGKGAGTGHTDDSAAEWIKTVESGEHGEAIKKAADFLWEMQREGLENRVKEGMLDRGTADDFIANEEFHVPLRSAIDAETNDFRGWGSKVGNEFHQAKGRETSAGDIVSHMFEEFSDAYTRAAENKVRHTLANLIRSTSGIGKIVEVKGETRVKEMRKTGDGGDPSILYFKEGGRVYRMELNGERGKLIADAITGRNIVAPFPASFRKAMRFWAATATEYSPTFAARNFVKDNIELTNIVFSEKGFRGGAEFVGRYAKNTATSSKALFDYVRTGKIDESTPEGKALKAFIKDGGMIHAYETQGYEGGNENFAKSLEKIAKRDKFAAEHAYINGAIHSIGYLNRMAELTTRFNAYRTQVEMGMGGREAALWSRRATVDFNRKGELTPITNTLRIFSNSTIGASARAMYALTKSKYGAEVVGSLFVVGVARGLLDCRNAGEDEKRKKLGLAVGKDMSEFDRANSLFYVRHGEKAYRMPMHAGPFSFVMYTGDCLARVAMGQMTVGKMCKELGLEAASVASHFTGLGEANFGDTESSVGENIRTFLTSAAPSIFQPFVTLLTNKDYAGRDVARPKFDDVLPSSQNGRKSTADEYKAVAEWLNSVTGGDKYERGVIDIAPEYVKVLAEGTGKNAMRDIANFYQFGKAILNGELPDLEATNTPLKRDFVRELDGNDNRYFKSYERYKEAKLGIDGRDKDRAWGEGERLEYLKEHPYLRKNGMTNTRIDRLVNGWSSDGTHNLGINDLRRMEGGEIRDSHGKWHKREWTKEQVEQFKARRLKLQAIVIELMGED